MFNTLLHCDFLMIKNEYIFNIVQNKHGEGVEVVLIKYAIRGVFGLILFLKIGLLWRFHNMFSIIMFSDASG